MWRDIPAICQTCQEAERVERRMWSPPWRIIQFFFISFSSHSLVLPVTLCLRFSTFMVCISVWILILNVLQTGSQLLHSAKSHIQGSAPLTLPPCPLLLLPTAPPRTPRPPWAQPRFYQQHQQQANASSHDNCTTTHGHYWHCFSLLL